MAGGGYFIPDILERWKTEWLEPAFGYIEGGQRNTDSHLNDVSIEYPGADVRSATNNFDDSRLLGTGTFGSVYKGTMKDGTEVAIKVLRVPQEAGFEDEVTVLSRFRHPNLVILMGFARHEESGGRSLIYEYLSGGDVSKRLLKSRQGAEPFEWRMRLSASLDAAQGLSHLHNLPVRAFHRDIKGPNILLDKNGTAKMADFGLSCVSSNAQHKVAQASGTVGYACPIYIRTGMITEGSEVHSFGMVLLEILTGAPPAVQRQDKPGEFCYLVDHLQGSREKALQMLDPSAHFPFTLAQSLTELAFKCITPKTDERPLFKHLVEDLRALLEQDWKTEAQHRAHRVSHFNVAGPTIEAGSPARWLQPQPCALPAVPAGLRVGQAVEARRRGGAVWCHGRIVGGPVNDRGSTTVGTYAVRYDDGELEDAVPVPFIRIFAERPGAPTAGSAKVGQAARPLRPLSPGPGRAAAAVSRPLDPAGYGASEQLVAQPKLSQHPLNKSRASVTLALETKTGGHRRLWCVFADSVELDRLKPAQRSISIPVRLGSEILVGRTAQPAAFWDTLVPDRRLHATVSREHFKIFVSGSEAERPTLSIACLSLNGLLINGDFMRQASGERVLAIGDVITLASSSDVVNAGHGDRSVTLAPRKQFIAFKLEACDVPTSNSIREVGVAGGPPFARPPAVPVIAARSGACIASSPSAVDMVRPRLLPDEGFEGVNDSGPVLERAPLSGSSPTFVGISRRGVGALLPPTSLPQCAEDDDEMARRGGSLRDGGNCRQLDETTIVDARHHISSQRSQALPLARVSERDEQVPDVCMEGVDDINEDDLFAKSGFRDQGSVAKAQRSGKNCISTTPPAASHSSASQRGTKFFF